MDAGPFIVVSDIHLGSDDACAAAFSHFCDWLEALESADSRGIPIVDEPEGRRIKTPQTLILLGDIVELWAPRSGDHTAALRDSFTIFNKLLALSCAKVYVLGNHDEELSEYYSYTKREENQGSPSFIPQNYVCGNGSLFLIVNGQYPNYHQQSPIAETMPKRKKKWRAKSGNKPET